MKNKFEGIRLTFYKQVQYLNAYLYTKQVENSIVICLSSIKIWLNKLSYKLQNIPKMIFIDGYERSDVVENYNIFENRIKKLKPYVVGFEKNDFLKFNTYS